MFGSLGQVGPSAGSRADKSVSVFAGLAGARSWSAFTLLELLVVLAIIGLLSAVALPAIRGLTQSNVIASANRQLADHIALARNWAIRDRTTVYMVFMPPADPMETMTGMSGSVRTNLLRGQQTSYALFTPRSVGDQPGRGHTRYLTRWYTLPEGVFIPTWKFHKGTNIPPPLNADIPPFDLTNNIPLPTLNGVYPNRGVPYIGFNYQGRLTHSDDQVIPLARGSIFYARTGSGALDWQPADALERPAGNSRDNYNLIQIDSLTSRSKAIRPELQ